MEVRLVYRACLDGAHLYCPSIRHILSDVPVVCACGCHVAPDYLLNPAPPDVEAALAVAELDAATRAAAARLGDVDLAAFGFDVVHDLEQTLTGSVMDCPFCDATRAFVVHEHTPNVGFCVVERKTYTLREGPAMRLYREARARGEDLTLAEAVERWQANERRDAPRCPACGDPKFRDRGDVWVCLTPACPDAEHIDDGDEVHPDDFIM